MSSTHMLDRWNRLCWYVKATALGTMLNSHLTPPYPTPPPHTRTNTYTHAHTHTPRLGGGPVHIASGLAGLAFCIFLGRRRSVMVSPSVLCALCFVLCALCSVLCHALHVGLCWVHLSVIFLICHSLHFQVEKHLPQNLTYMSIGTGLLMFGWLLFNSGSEYSANARSVCVCLCVYVCVCVCVCCVSAV